MSLPLFHIVTLVSLAAGTIYCDEPFECANSTQTGTFGSFYGRGYKSCYGILTSITGYWHANPWGAYACRYAQEILIEDIFYCDGICSCADITVGGMTSTDGREMKCHGTLACFGSLLNGASGLEITCNGEKSCMNTIINDGYDIYGNGAYSLENSIITGNGATNTELRVHLKGYLAGYNLTIYCESGLVTCTINCYGNGCYNTYYNCDLSTNCVINCNETQNIYCPINMSSIDANISLSTDINSIYDLELVGLKTISKEFRYDYDIVGLSDISDDRCSYSSNSSGFVFDNYYTNSDGYIKNLSNSNENGNICCRGEISCYKSILSLNNGGSGDIVCSARNGCSYAAYINPNGGNVYCMGEQACDSATRIENAATVYCGGEYGCRKTTIADCDNVICSGYVGGCYATQLYSISNIYFLAENYDHVTASNVYSQGKGVINIYYMAYKAAQYMNVYCNGNNDTCNIYCLTNFACNNASFICENNSTCNIYCDIDNGIECGNSSTIITNINSSTSYPDAQINIYNITEIYYSIPTQTPTTIPTAIPTRIPTMIPKRTPTSVPTTFPIRIPTIIPTTMPTTIPTSTPTIIPSKEPTMTSSPVPSAVPSILPSFLPSIMPSFVFFLLIFVWC